MALTKVGSGGIENVTNSANATFLTIDASEQITVASEGGAVTTSVQQGLCKAWVGNINHTSQDFEDSFNASSYTDPGVGRGQITLTNNMSNGGYSVTHGSMSNYPYQAQSDSTSQYTLSIVSSSGSFADGQANGMVAGDLA